MHEANHRGLVECTLFTAGNARALDPFHTLDQLLHDAPPGHGGFKFRPRRLHALPVKCDFGVFGVGQLPQVPLVSVQRLLPRGIERRAGRDRRVVEHAPALVLEFPAVPAQRRVFTPRQGQRLAFEVFLALPHAQEHRVTFD